MGVNICGPSSTRYPTISMGIYLIAHYSIGWGLRLQDFSLLVGVVWDELARIPLMASFPIGLQLFSASLYRYQNFESFKDALDLPLILRVYLRTVGYGLLPLLGFCGIIWILGPFSILVVFIISLVILVYFTSLYRAIEYGNL